MKKEEVDLIIKKLPANEDAVKDILKLVGNNNTKIVESDNIKGNYYSFLNDTMYISKVAKNTNDYNRIIVICHECVHSIQNKALQLAHTIVSHLTLISYIIAIIFIILNINLLEAIIIPITILCIVIRGVLEANAMTTSLDLYSRYVKGKLSEEEIKNTYEFFYKNIKIGRIIYFFKIVIDKLIPVAILILINLIKHHIFN